MRSALRPRLEPLEDRCLLSGGVLDPTFSGGFVTTALGDNSEAVATYPQEGTGNDGKVVVAGTGFAVVRYNLDGSLDTSFGGTGEAMSPKGQTYYAVAVQPDGKVLAAGLGKTVSIYEVVRFNVNGTLDLSFGKRGIASMYLATNVNPSVGQMVLQPDGKIVVAGLNGGDLAVERFTGDGNPDTTFGSNGFASTGLGGPFEPINDYHAKLALDPNNGNIVVVGETQPGQAVVRYDTHGVLDTTFGSINGTPGYVALSKLVYPSVAVQSDHSVVVAGTIFLNNAGTKEIGLDRLTPTGQLDASFGGTGAVTTPLSGITYARAVTTQANGQILVGGNNIPSPTSGNSTFVVARYNNTDGSLDSTFGTNGIATGGTAGGSIAMALEPDGRIVLAGSTNVSGQVAFALARFLATGPHIDSFTDPVITGSSVTLTASVAALNPGSTVTQVAFYYFDSSGNKVTLGTVTGTQTSPGVWSFTLTVNLAPGSYTLFAQAEDSYGAFSDPLALGLTL
jgi:uncharacterized delta-60 repeat protein